MTEEPYRWLEAIGNRREMNQSIGRAANGL